MKRPSTQHPSTQYPSPQYLSTLICLTWLLVGCEQPHGAKPGDPGLATKNSDLAAVDLASALVPGPGLEAFLQGGGVLNPNVMAFAPAKLKFPQRGPRLPISSLSRAYPNLPLVRPLHLTAPPDGTDRVCIVEQDGRILIFPNLDNVTTAKTFLDLRNRVSRNDNEEGLLSLAFPPDYAQSQQAYVFYTVTGASPRNVIARFTISSDPNALDPASELVVLQVDQPFANHRGGSLQFGPDGMLYIGFGDGGGQGDPLGLAQDLTKCNGKILRIDPRNGTQQQPYLVPADNPFNRQGSPNRPEIWASGFRNPWRFAFEPGVAGRLWLGDVGQSTREEVNIVSKGANHGWSFFEGTRVYRPGANGDEFYTAPVLEYGGSLGRCVIGGMVYTGRSAPGLVGRYVFGDYWSGRVWALTESKGRITSQVEVATIPQLCSFGADSKGEIYAISMTGTISRFGPGVKQTEENPFPTKLSGTGLFTDLATLQPARGVLPYELNSPFWSDGAVKRRWIAPSAARSITFHPTDGWSFSDGTVTVKHFEIELVRGDPRSIRRLETRVMVKEVDGWTGYTYRWNAAQTDADLLAAADKETLTIRDTRDPFFSERQVWDYPSGSDCMLCHTPGTGQVLGPRTLQLNRMVHLYGTPVNQLDVWNVLGLFTAPIGFGSSYQAYADPTNRALALAERARSYLGANCAHCHNPSATIPGDLDLRWTTPLANTNAVWGWPVHSSMGLTNSHIITPKARASSVLWERMRRLDDYRMPPLGSHIIDSTAVDLIGAWIDSL